MNKISANKTSRGILLDNSPLQSPNRRLYHFFNKAAAEPMTQYITVKGAVIKYSAIFLLLIVFLWGSVSFALQWPDTGQTLCYDSQVITCPQPGQDYYGQDAQYQGPVRSYTKLGAGGVELPDAATQDQGWLMTRDNTTGLIWEIKTNDGEIHDKDDRYTWCDTNPDTNGGDEGTCRDGTDTEDFITVLNNENFGGYPDWRLPTNKELASLVDLSIPCPGPTIDTAYFPNINSSSYSIYWSSTTYDYDTTVAWYVHFTYGSVDHTGKGVIHYVRAVRSEQVEPVDRFTDNQNGTVTDTETGLMWQKCTMSHTYNSSTGDCDDLAFTQQYLWTEALAQCESLDLAGYADWRLPNRNELMSLVDYSQNHPTIDTGYFPDTISANYLSSTTDAYIMSYAWGIDFAVGNGGDQVKIFRNYVRAVRTEQSGTSVISAVEPATGNVGGGTCVTITGTGFGTTQGSGSITFGGVAATISSWTDTEIVCTTPSHAEGAVNVVVTNADGQSATKTAAFTYDTSDNNLLDTPWIRLLLLRD